MDSEHSNIEWCFGDGERITLTVPDRDWTHLAAFYDELKAESWRRKRCQMINTWVFRILIIGLIAGWWVLAFVYGNTYCK